MANHPYNAHREQQVAHRRVDTILKGSPSGAKQHAQGHAFSKITSKSAAVRDNDIRGDRGSPKRYARGGKVKGKGSTNIAIVVPGAKGGPPLGPPPGGPMGAPPMAGPGGPPMMPPPPGMPMRARGGKITAGAETGEGRMQQAKRAAKRGI